MTLDEIHAHELDQLRRSAEYWKTDSERLRAFALWCTSKNFDSRDLDWRARDALGMPPHSGKPQVGVTEFVKTL